MLQIAVCDDSTADQKRICRAVWDARPEAQICVFTSPGAMLEKIGQDCMPTVALLDIQMADMNGICLAKELNARWPDCRIIFLTDFLEYATDVYDVRHSYFILKSQLEQRMEAALTRALEELPRSPMFSLRIKGEVHLVSRDSVLYLERRLRKTFVHGNDGCYETYEHPRDILSNAEEECFCQCHQSFWANLNRVSLLTEDHFRMDNGSEVPISRRFQKHVKTQFFALLQRHLFTPPEDTEDLPECPQNHCVQGSGGQTIGS